MTLKQFWDFLKNQNYVLVGCIEFLLGFKNSEASLDCDG